MNFVQRLQTIQRRNNSLLCIGLDTDLARIPKFLQKYSNPQYEFNRRIIDETKDLVCAYKLNLAFYETIGEDGWSTVHRTLDYIPKEIVTIGDGKRGDISSSAEWQARLFYEDWNFSASTVSPYMGRDSIEPFIRRNDRCAFVLAVTSNKGSKDFQYLKVGGKLLYEHVVRKAIEWNAKKNIGFVAGATHPKDLHRIRSLAPEMPILVPGIGAQRGNLEAAVRYGCDKNGELAIINVGRSVIYTSTDEDFAEKAREAATDYRDQINRHREKYFEREKLNA